MTLTFRAAEWLHQNASHSWLSAPLWSKHTGGGVGQSTMKRLRLVVVLNAEIIIFLICFIHLALDHLAGFIQSNNKTLRRVVL